MVECATTYYFWVCHSSIRSMLFLGVKWLHPVGNWNGVLCVGSEVLNFFMYFAGLSTNFCHSMVTISAFVEKLWSTYTHFCWKGLVEGGPKEATNSINSSLLWDVFVLQKIEVCVTYYWIVGVFIDWIGCNRNRNQQKIVVENILSLLLFFRFWWNNG